MDHTPDELWLAFQQLAKTYPHDNGVRLTQDLARWLAEEHLLQQLPIPAIVKSVLPTSEGAEPDEPEGHS